MPTWLIERGSYSDYYVAAVAECDEDTAKAIVERMNFLDPQTYDPYEYSERDIIRSTDDVRLRTMHYFELIARPGKDAKSRTWSFTDLEIGPEPDERVTVQQWTPEDSPAALTLRGTFGVRVGTDDRERSIKIASDRMAQMRAEANEIAPTS